MAPSYERGQAGKRATPGNLDQTSNHGLTHRNRIASRARQLAWHGKGNLAVRLAQSLKSAIERGTLPAGCRLPPERTLAGVLLLSRGTVSAAYDLLKSQGLLEARERGQTTVIGHAAYRAFLANQTDRIEPGSGPMTTSLIRTPPDTIDFAVAAVLPVPMLGATGVAVMTEFAGDAIADHGYLPSGLLSLRERIANWYCKRGCPTSVDNIVVTSGANQAVSLLLNFWAGPGDAIATEDPTYPGGVDLMRATFARVHAVPVDDDGVDITALASFLAAASPRAVFCSTSFQNPTGRGMPVERRERLAHLSARYNLPVIEDNASANVDLRGAFDNVPPTLSAWAPEAPIFSVGSVDKLLWTGLRVGWLRSPPRFVPRLQELKAMSDLTTSLISQRLSERLLDEPAVLAYRRTELAARLAVLEGELARALPEWRWAKPDGGLVLWVDTGSDDAARFATIAAKAGIRVGVGSSFSLAQRHARKLRLTYSLPEETIRVGVARLAESWHALQDRTRRRTEHV